MGTNIQEVFDSFFAKCPETDFTGKETLVYQLFKSGIAHCYRDVSESLAYTFDDVIYTGYFNEILEIGTIELIALCMKREFTRRSLDKYNSIKQHIGTSAFNKLPDTAKQYDVVKEQYNTDISDVEEMKQDSYKYDE